MGHKQFITAHKYVNALFFLFDLPSLPTNNDWETSTDLTRTCGPLLLQYIFTYSAVCETPRLEIITITEL